MNNLFWKWVQDAEDHSNKTVFGHFGNYTLWFKVHKKNFSELIGKNQMRKYDIIYIFSELVTANKPIRMASCSYGK